MKDCEINYGNDLDNIEVYKAAKTKKAAPKVYNEYLKQLDKDEKLRLNSYLNSFGGIYSFLDDIYEVSELYSLIDESNDIKVVVEVPFLDKKKGKIYVRAKSVVILLAEVISKCGFERYKNAIRDFYEIEHALKRDEELLMERKEIEIKRKEAT